MDIMLHCANGIDARMACSCNVYVMIHDHSAAVLGNADISPKVAPPLLYYLLAGV